jgi:hypothetical protein
MEASDEPNYGDNTYRNVDPEDPPPSCVSAYGTTYRNAVVLSMSIHFRDE